MGRKQKGGSKIEISDNRTFFANLFNHLSESNLLKRPSVSEIKNNSCNIMDINTSYTVPFV